MNTEQVVSDEALNILIAAESIALPQEKLKARAISMLAREIKSLRAQLASHNRVNIPVDENEAAMMILLGADWLEQNAPERLKQVDKWRDK